MHVGTTSGSIWLSCLQWSQVSSADKAQHPLPPVIGDFISQPTSGNAQCISILDVCFLSYIQCVYVYNTYFTAKQVKVRLYSSKLLGRSKGAWSSRPSIKTLLDILSGNPSITMEDPPFVGEFAIGNGWKGHVLAYVSFKFTGQPTRQPLEVSKHFLFFWKPLIDISLRSYKSRPWPALGTRAQLLQKKGKAPTTKSRLQKHLQIAVLDTQNMKGISAWAVDAFVFWQQLHIFMFAIQNFASPHPQSTQSFERLCGQHCLKHALGCQIEGCHSNWHYGQAIRIQFCKAIKLFDPKRGSE